MDRVEARITNYLASHLELLEDGLTLQAKEYGLPNAFGTSGRIDLVARDRFGHVVVIEVKRSNQTAREAIHELSKYTGLLLASQGLRCDQLRAVLLSTEWSELAVPFSQYLKESTIPTEGFLITADDTGAVTSVSRFDPIDIARPLVISESQDIILFSDVATRDDANGKVALAAAKAGLSDFVLLRLNYRGNSERVVYRYGIYFLFSSPFEAMSVAEITAAKQKMGGKNRRKPDDAFLVDFRRALGPIGNDSERGYPEKLSVIISSGWQVDVVSRHGLYAENRKLVPDEQVIKEAMQEEGGASYYMTRTASPKYEQSWLRLKESAKRALGGDGRWVTIVPKILSEIARQRSTATVSVRIYSPTDIVFGLAKLFRYGEPSYLPALEIIVTDGNESVAYYGMLIWPGQAVNVSAEQWLMDVFGSKLEYMTMHHLRRTYEREEQARKKLGLCSVVLEVRDLGGERERIVGVDISRGRLMRKSLSADALQQVSLYSFAANNREFGSSLVALVAGFTSGWVS